MKKVNMEIITAHNGVEVIILHKTEYKHTELDEIRSDWREQERKRRKSSEPIMTELFKKIKRWCA